MKDLTNETVYGFTGQDGLVAKVISLTREGYEVCHEATHSMGLGTYMVAYKEPTVQKESLQKASPLDKAEVTQTSSPDFILAKGFLTTSKSETEAKISLIKYASSFEGIEESFFDKRKSFAKLLSTFSEKWKDVS
jgi:hypothetical protein